MVDDDDTATTDTPMTPSAPIVGTAMVHTASATEPPPPITVDIGEVLRWIADVTTIAGPPDEIDISITTQHINIAAPDQTIHASWQTTIGAVVQPARHDALGSVVIATTPYRGLWSVTVRVHVAP